LCASCLAKLSLKKETTRHRWALAPRLILALLAIVVVYITFLLLGNSLLSIPSEFHHAGGW